MSVLSAAVLLAGCARAPSGVARPPRSPERVAAERPHPLQLSYSVRYVRAPHAIDVEVALHGPARDFQFTMPGGVDEVVAVAADGSRRIPVERDGRVRVPRGASRLSYRYEVDRPSFGGMGDLYRGAGRPGSLLVAGRAYLIRPRVADGVRALLAVEGAEALLPWEPGVDGTWSLSGTQLVDSGFHSFGGRRCAFTIGGAAPGAPSAEWRRGISTDDGNVADPSEAVLHGGDSATNRSSRRLVEAETVSSGRESGGEQASPRVGGGTVSSGRESGGEEWSPRGAEPEPMPRGRESSGDGSSPRAAEAETVLSGQDSADNRSSPRPTELRALPGDRAPDGLRFSPGAAEPAVPDPASAARIQVAIHDGELRVADPFLCAWIEEAATEVLTVRDGFPYPRTTVHLMPGWGSEPSPLGLMLWSNPPSLAVVVGERAEAPSFERDWVAVHELLHLIHPSFLGEAPWLTEGLATYYTEVARMRSGRYSEADGWAELVRGFDRGQAEADERTLEECVDALAQGSYLATYWAGALIALELDVEIRRATGNARSLDDVLEHLAREGQTSTVGAFGRAVDAVAQRPVFEDVLARHRRRPALARVDPLLERLGVVREGSRVRFVDAPDAQVRGAIASSGAR